MALDFERLQCRLILLLKEGVRSGQYSERQLALRAGISQPHLHNILCGKRLLSLRMADRLLHCLHLDLNDLLATIRNNNSG